ncbi:MAG: hypothetical protein ABIR26_04780 [Ramlibacter sp.]
MASKFTLSAWLPLLSALLFAPPASAGAQAFVADYALTRPGGALAPSIPLALFGMGAVRVGPAIPVDTRFSGAGLSLEAGPNWYGQVGVGRSLQPNPSLPGGSSLEDVLAVSGGYRWSDGESVSLQLSRSRSAERVGLAVSYDWPRYFVRFSYDPGLRLTPVDVLRFSAGVRF